jgi:hypothetical protein
MAIARRYKAVRQPMWCAISCVISTALSTHAVSSKSSAEIAEDMDIVLNKCLI